MYDIPLDLFQRRLLVMLVRSPIRHMPTRARDREILFRAVTRGLPADPTDERTLNDALRSWLGHVAPSIGVDHVSLRRYLVEVGYLEREDDGSAYRVVSSPRTAPTFDPRVDEVDVASLVTASRAEVEQRRQLHPPTLV